MDKITRIILIIATIIIIGIVIAAAFVFISQKPDEEKIIGTWSLDSFLIAGNPATGISNFEIEFKSDGTYEAGIYEGTWQIKDGKLKMTNFGYSTTAADGFKYSFTNDDNRLTLYNDDSFMKYEMIFSKL